MEAPYDIWRKQKRIPQGFAGCAFVVAIIWNVDQACRLNLFGQTQQKSH